MRVLSVLFDDRYGGPQKRTLEAARALRARGVEIVLCLPAGDGNAAAFAEKEGIAVRRVAFARIPPPRQWWRVLWWCVCLPRDLQRFRVLYHRERPDVVHVNGAFFFAPALAARLARVPLVWHLIDVIVPRPLTPFFAVVVGGLADQVVASSHAVARHYRVAKRPYAVLYPPVDVPRSPLRRAAAAGNPELYRVGLIANWNPTKGVEYFVQAAARLRAQLGDKLQIVFAGARYPTQADYCRRIEELIDRLGLSGSVRDLGFVSSVWDALSEMDVLVSSALSEAVGMTVLEAMAAGVPVVATNVGGTPELLLADPARPAGLLVPPRDPEALAAALFALQQDPARAAELAANGRQLAIERFSLDLCAERHLEVYSRLAGRS